MVAREKQWHGLLYPVLLWRLAAAALSTNCLKKDNDTLQPYGGGLPCGVVTPDSPFVTCCNDDDFCVGDGICHFDGSRGSDFTGYYIGGCTDPTYADSSCSAFCTDVSRQDIIYNDSTQTWACCGETSDGGVNCEDPSVEETFSAPAPSLLSTTFAVGEVAQTAAITELSTTSTNSHISSTDSSTIISSTGSTTITAHTVSSTGSLTVTTHTVSSAATSGSNNASSTLSSGAKAGIGVGVTVAAIALIGSVLFYMRGRPKNNLSSRYKGGYEIDKSGETFINELEGSGGRARELPGSTRYNVEIGGNERYELH